MGFSQITFNLQVTGSYLKTCIPSYIFYLVLCVLVLPMPTTFHFGQNFIEEKRLETLLETATHICEDLKTKNISSPDLGKFVHRNWYEDLCFELMCYHQFLFPLMFCVK